MQLNIEVDKLVGVPANRHGFSKNDDETQGTVEFAGYRQRDGKRKQMFRYRLSGKVTATYTQTADFVSPEGGCDLSELWIEVMPERGTHFEGRWRVLLVDAPDVQTPPPPAPAPAPAPLPSGALIPDAPANNTPPPATPDAPAPDATAAAAGADA